jgi:hypothetical protein
MNGLEYETYGHIINGDLLTRKDVGYGSYNPLATSAGKPKAVR